MSPSSKPRRMGVPSLWAGCVHTPGESGQVGMVKVQAVPAAQADLTPSAGFHPPRGRGGGVVRADTHLRSFLEQKVKWAEAAAKLARHNSP